MTIIGHLLEHSFVLGYIVEAFMLVGLVFVRLFDRLGDVAATWSAFGTVQFFLVLSFTSLLLPGVGDRPWIATLLLALWFVFSLAFGHLLVKSNFRKSDPA